MHWGYDGMGWMMGWWWLFWIAVLVAIVWLVAKSVGGSSVTQGESPEAILKGRYARGEIDRDEYQRRLDDLRK